ncbi:MAG: glycoside hydrolase family 3 C-terminal domain-containing protein [Bacteroidales bacterium]|nr:glycoside hydrolase family 3 C-terminal domain-containing protein [Bacteroidales bacterium]
MLKKIQITGLLIVLISIGLTTFSQSLPDYKNSRLPVKKRVNDLLSRMTVEEKVAQLMSMRTGRPKLTDEIFNNSFKMDSMFRNGMGMMNPAIDVDMEATVKYRNRLQSYIKNKSRLGIPIIYIDEAHHGLCSPGVDVFPHSIGLACSWDIPLVESIYNFIAAQSNARGTDLVLAPVVDICRDPRWGRTGETFGEDPYLCGTIGAAVVRGFQGSSDGSIAINHVAATLKHFSGHGQSESGLNQAPANYSQRVLREYHLESFRHCIRDANPACIMPSYNEIDGMPSHANKWLLTEVLRKEWNYKGVLVSDWFAIDQLWNKHYIVADMKAAALAAFKAGVTIDLPYGKNYKYLVELYNEKKFTMAELDTAVSYMLNLKFKLGLFEKGDIDITKAKAAAADKKGRALALKAAEESMVLLKNDNKLLPLKQGQYKSIAIIGPCAAVNYLGDYAGIPLHNVSLLEGLKNKAGSKTKILYAKGCMLTKNGDTVSMNNYQYTGIPVFPAREENMQLIKEAVEVAKQADFVILAVGENEQFSREAGMPDRMGDAVTLDLLSDQEELVKAVAATGKPFMVYLMNARPLSINRIAQNAPAIIEGWFAGEEAGNAFANILFGETCPSGKLTISIPRSVGQIPVYYNHKPSAQFYDYVNEKAKPLYPFGFGLSYNTYEYSKPRLSAPVMKKDGSVFVEIDVTNRGNMKGDEIVQLYIRDLVSSVTRPVKELKDFARISLNPGETKTVKFRIDASKLSFWTADMKYEAEPGDFEIMTGPSSDLVQKIVLKLTE